MTSSENLVLAVEEVVLEVHKVAAAFPEVLAHLQVVNRCPKKTRKGFLHNFLAEWEVEEAQAAAKLFPCFQVWALAEVKGCS